jgi:A/G-specific adenine glycosylase
MEDLLPESLPEISHRLLAWFFANRRELAWREEADPYRIWVSEVMLQQTRAETVSAYYPRFLERFPDLASLARAEEQQVLKAWEGLGYYGRARNLHRAARALVERHGGRLPDDLQALEALPGVGAYTAAALASIAFARPCPAVDGNVIRVVSRLLAEPGDPGASPLRRRVRLFVEASFQRYHPGWINQAWMELGALVCRPSPACPGCPLGFACRALRQGRVRELPQRRPSPAPPVRRGFLFLLLPSRVRPGLRAELAAAMADPPALGRRLRERGLPLLLARRPSRGLLGGLWELPNALEQNPVTFESANGVKLLAASDAEVSQRYSHFEARFRPRLGLLGERLLEPWVEQRWVAPAELAGYPRPRVHIKALRLFGLES